jgi:hypothetical protein
MKAEPNLRGWRATVRFDGRAIRVTVVTHIRNDFWMVDGRRLPDRFIRGWFYGDIRRAVVPRSALKALKAPR